MSKSAYIQLYDDESKHDDYKFLIKNVQAKLSFEDAKEDRDMEFKAGAYKFKYGANLGSVFDLATRFGDIETDVSALEADPATTNNAAAIAAEIVARTAADTAISNLLTAEVNRATGAEGTLTTAVAAEATRAAAAEAVNAAAVVSEATARTSADTAEAAARAAADAALQSQITNILSNTDPAALDSLSELLSHINSADATLIASIATLQAQVTALQAKVDELTNS